MYHKRVPLLALLTMVCLFLIAGGVTAQEDSLTYPIVDTGQVNCYNDDGDIIDCSVEGEPFYGQDAQYSSIEFSFTDNGDGTVTDNVAGLMWQQIPDDGDFTWDEAIIYAENLELAGYDDWRLPTAKELFSLIDFEPDDGKPVLDTDYFAFPALSENPGGEPGDAGPQGGAPQDDSETGEDTASDMPAPPPADDEATGGIQKSQGQFWSSNFYYVGTTHGDADTAFGVNHVTGHIKGYPAGDASDEQMGKRVRVVRGDEYGVNEFVDNGDGTISDLATGLMWMQDDYGEAIEWEAALAHAENLEFAGYDDWKLPSVKELQSIVDYSGVYPAVDPDYFNSTMEEDEDYWTWLWTSTSADESGGSIGAAWYVAFGKAVGLDGLDSHGAGAVRERQKYAESQYTEEGDTYVNSLRAVRVITIED